MLTVIRLPIVLATLIAIADNGSFTAAAKSLGLPKSTVSRRLSAYEKSLCISLFNRSTRALSLTDEGVRYYEIAKPVVDAAIDVSRSMMERTAEPSGPGDEYFSMFVVTDECRQYNWQANHS